MGSGSPPVWFSVEARWEWFVEAVGSERVENAERTSANERKLTRIEGFTLVLLGRSSAG